jgi:arabinofuranosyltransferase
MNDETARMPEGSTELRGWRFIVAAIPVVGVFTAVYAVTAWQCDDAYITHRSIDNLLAGHGLRWQPPERVQSFTHPLWLFLLVPARALTGEAYYSTLALSYVISARAWCCFSLARRAAALRIRAGGVALLSQAFVDYSSSGLENPLSHLLGGVDRCWRRRGAEGGVRARRR